MLGPADIEAWTDDRHDDVAPTVTPPLTATERAERRRTLFARVAMGSRLSADEWRELRGGFLGR